MSEKRIWLNFFRLVLVTVVVSALFLLPPVKQLSWMDFNTDKAYALSNNVTASDVYAAWLFNNDATDSVGSNDLTEDETPFYTSSGVREGTHIAYLASSDNDSFHINDADLDAGFPGKDGVAEQDFTVTTWFRINSYGYHDIIGKWDQTNDERSWRLYLNNNKVEFTVGHTNGTDNTTIQCSTSIVTSSYYHIACSYNATDNYMKLRVWNDTGRIQLTNATGTAGGDMSSTNATIWFGSDNQIDAGTDNTMQGSFDEVLVFNSFLSDDDIDAVRSGIYQRTYQPSIVTVWNDSQVRLPSQRNSFYAEGLHWVFYADGYNDFYYTTSSDNSTWTTPTKVAALGSPLLAACYDISFNGTHVAYIRNNDKSGDNYEGIRYRLGVPQSNGSISWVDTEKIVYSDSIKADDISLAFDSEGYPWIASTNGTNREIINVITSTTNDGTWSANSSYPQVLENTGSDVTVGLLVPQTNKKMVCLMYNSAGSAATIRARSFDGSTWGASENATDTLLSNSDTGGFWAQLSAVSFDDTIHLVMTEDGTKNIQYYSGSEGSWSSNTTLYTASGQKASPVIAKHSTDQLVVFWTDDDEHIYYDHFDGSSWDGVVDWINGTDYLYTPSSKPNNQCFYESDSNIIGLTYMMNPGSDQSIYGVEYAAINTTDLGWDATGIVIPTVTTQNATSVEETTATGNGNITAIGGENCTERGTAYDTDSGWPYSSNVTSNGDYGTGNFTSSLTGLTQGELYYASAFAGNNAGYGHGDEVTFLTKPNGSTGFSDTSTTNTTVSLSWTNGTGMDYVEIRYQENSYVSDNASGTLGYWGSGSSTTVSGLSANTTYYFSLYTHATEGGLWNTADTVGQDTAYTSNPASPSPAASSDTIGNVETILMYGVAAVIILFAIIVLLNATSIIIAFISVAVIITVLVAIIQNINILS